MNPPLNRIKIVNQLKISGKDNQTRIPDGILYINGLPLVVFEFKSAVREQKPVLAMPGSSSVNAIAGIFRNCLSTTRSALLAMA